MISSDVEYFRHPYTSNSDLTKFKGSRSYGDKEKAFAFGSLVHAAILQFERLDVLKFTFDGNPVSGDDMVAALKMRASFYSNDFCKRFAGSCDKEVEFYNRYTEFVYNGKRFSIDTKRKYDLWNAAGNFGGDIKTTAAETREEFLKAIDEFDYDRSRVFYAKGPNANRDVIIGISKKNYEIFLVPMKNDSILWCRGEEKLNELAFKYWNSNLPF